MRTRSLASFALAAACSTKPSPSASRTEAHASKPSDAQPQSSVSPVALTPQQLPGWTFRSADEGWWTAAGDEQLFVSHVDLGSLASGTSAAERAELLATVYREANRRQGGAPLAVATGALTAQAGRPVACITAVNASAHAHAFSCGIARDSGPVLGIEYTSYRDDSLDAFHARAQALIASVAAVAN